MAIMHPPTIIEYNADSEREMFEALKTQLNSKFHVFYSRRWYSKTEDGKRIDSECDFLIYEPSMGYICLEVKGGCNIRVKDDEWFILDTKNSDERKLKCSPYLQSEKSMRYFKALYERKYNDTFEGIYGHAAAFPHYAAQSLGEFYVPEETIDINDMDSLENKIRQIFIYFKDIKGTCFMSESTQENFLKCLNDEINLSVAKGGLIESMNYIYKYIDHDQEAYIDFLTNYKETCIIGGAGTGKTYLGIKKIQRYVNSRQDALYLCSNKMLADEVKQKINNSYVDCYDMESLKNSRSKNKSTNIKKVYDLVVVDEGQDFDKTWAKYAKQQVKKDGELWVLYDEDQNLYKNDILRYVNYFGIKNPPFILRYNVRNTGAICKYAKNNTRLGVDTQPCEVEGAEPVLKKMSENDALMYIDGTIKKLVKENIKLTDIVILSNKTKERSILNDIEKVGGYDIDKQIKFYTVEEFKGLESNIIIYLNHTYKDEPMDSGIQATNYVACTRAKYYLYEIQIV